MLNYFQDLSLPFDVLLTTYDIVLMDQEFLAQIPWHYTVIDEAQRLKNPSSVCVFALFFLAKIFKRMSIVCLEVSA